MSSPRPWFSSGVGIPYACASSRGVDHLGDALGRGEEFLQLRHKFSALRRISDVDHRDATLRAGEGVALRDGRASGAEVAGLFWRDVGAEKFFHLFETVVGRHQNARLRAAAAGIYGFHEHAHKLIGQRALCGFRPSRGRNGGAARRC